MRSVLHVITGLENGGAEAVLYRLVTNDTYNEHTVVSLQGMGKYGPMLEQHGINVHCLHMPKGGVNFRGVVALWKLMREQKPYLLQTWMYHGDMIGGVVGKFAGIKRVYWCIHNSTLLRKSTPWKTLIVTKICAALSYFLPDKIISCAQSAIDVNSSEGYKRSKFRLVPNGYDLREFQPDKNNRDLLRKEWNISSGTFLIGMVARFDPQKDIANLISALSIFKNQNSDFKLIMAGQGMNTGNTELNNWLEAAGIAERTLTIGSRSDIPAVMNALDTLVLSSRYGEAFPNALCEAMSCGTPCVSTTVGDSAFIIADTGWVAPPASPEQLADNIQHAFETWQKKEEWSVLQNKARKRILENFSVERMVEGYRSVWGS